MVLKLIIPASKASALNRLKINDKEKINPLAIHWKM
jgi:hypothetical protein